MTIEKKTRLEEIMVASNLPYPLSPSASNRLAESLRGYFDRHPEVSPREFLANAVQREIEMREQQEGTRFQAKARRPIRQTPPTAEDVRIHHWLNQRLAATRRGREGVWAKVCRFFAGHPAR